MLANMKSNKLEFMQVPTTGVSPTAGSAPSNATASTSETSSIFSDVSGAIRKAKHPVAALFHVAFKIAAILVYIFAGFFSDSYVFVFVICILLLAFDFWTVKNVTGRLLVGLRWWNKIKPDGSNEWVFESLEDMTEIGYMDSRIFWIGLYGAPVMWLALFIVGLLKFNLQWLLIVAVALTLSGANIVGYTKCKKDAKAKMQALMSSGALGALKTSTGSSFMSSIVGMAFGDPSGANTSSANSV